VAGDPECTPIPLTAVWWRKVVCLPAFMLKSVLVRTPAHAKRAAP
jgi:hypothetical protein